MKHRWSSVAAPILTAALVLSACASDAVGESVEPAESVDASTSTIAPQTTTTAAIVDPPSEPDADRSSPTTDTDGLESDVEAPVELAGLTCWRVEDFGEEAADRWRVINDGVMGGLSEGFLAFDGGVATFSGTINTNGGGFSMIRTDIFRNGALLADSLEGAEYLRIRTRSANGRGYELTVQDGTTNTAIMHFADLAVTADSAWEEPLVPLTNLDARAFGSARPTLPAFELDQISTLGIILADGLDGPFSIAIDRIDACAIS